MRESQDMVLPRAMCLNILSMQLTGEYHHVKVCPWSSYKPTNTSNEFGGK